MIVKLLYSHYSLEEARRAILMLFTPLKNIKFEEEDEYLSIFSYTNYYDEEFYP